MDGTQTLIEPIAEHQGSPERECRWCGPVPYEHHCRRTGESAMEAASRYLGESRDV